MPLTDEERAQLHALLDSMTTAELEEVAEDLAEDIEEVAEETGDEEDEINAEVAEVLAEEVTEEKEEGDHEAAIDLVEEIVELADESDATDVESGPIADDGIELSTGADTAPIESDSPPPDVPPRTEHWFYRRWFRS